jgi:voltage-gated potassium channel
MTNRQSSLPKILGLMGVASDESHRAQKTARLFEGPMLLLACWILIDWLIQSNNPDFNQLTISDWVIWTFFMVETSVLTLMVKRKLTYLKNNWVNLLIIIFSFPLLWEIFPHAAGFRALRLVVLFVIFVQASHSLRTVLSRNHLGSTLVASFFVIVVAGTLMSMIDPNVNTPLDGIWWAWVTVTTVGYGDIVPATNAGRVFGAFLILLGIGLFTMLTASFAAFFMAEEEKEMIQEEDENIKRLTDIELRLMMLESKLDTLLTEEQKRQVNSKHTQQP